MANGTLRVPTLFMTADTFDMLWPVWGVLNFWRKCTRGRGGEGGRERERKGEREAEEEIGSGQEIRDTLINHVVYIYDMLWPVWSVLILWRVYEREREIE